MKEDERFEEALEIFNNLIKETEINEDIKKSYIDVLFAYGHHLNDDYTEEYEKAIEIYDQILKLEPNNHKAIYYKGVSYFYMNDFEKALKYYLKSLEIKPDYKFAYYNIGLAYESMGDLHRALKYYKNALEIDPNFLYANNAKADVEQKIRHFGIPKPKPEINANKLIPLFEVSKRVRISMIQDILNLEKDDLDIIINWCKKYDFEIDGDFLVINKTTLTKFLESLENDIFYQNK